MKVIVLLLSLFFVANATVIRNCDDFKKEMEAENPFFEFANGAVPLENCWKTDVVNEKAVIDGGIFYGMPVLTSTKSLVITNGLFIDCANNFRCDGCENVVIKENVFVSTFEKGELNFKDIDSYSVVSNLFINTGLYVQQSKHSDGLAEMYDNSGLEIPKKKNKLKSEREKK